RVVGSRGEEGSRRRPTWCSRDVVRAPGYCSGCNLPAAAGSTAARGPGRSTSGSPLRPGAPPGDGLRSPLPPPHALADQREISRAHGDEAEITGGEHLAVPRQRLDADPVLPVREPEAD